MSTLLVNTMQQVDVWGIGCVCLEMCLLQRFDYAYELAMDSKGIFDKVQDLYGEKMAQFLRACLVLKYEQRPSAEQVLQQFFNISISQVVPSTPTLEEVSIESESPSSMLKLENNFSTTKSDQSASARRKRMEEVLASMSKDVQILIFSFLPANSIAKCQLVCKGWYLLVTSSAYIWKQLFEYDYETKVNEKLERKYMQEYGSVRNAFSYRSNLERNWCSTNQYTFSAFKIEDTKHVHHVKIFQDEQLAKYLIEKYPPKIAAPTKKDSKRNQLASMADDSFAMTIKTEALMQGEQLMALTTTNNGAMQLHMISGLGTGLANPTIKHRMLHTFPDGHKHALWAVDYNRAKNEKLICTGGHDRDIMIWDILSGDSVHRFTTAHQNEIWDICFYTKTSVASVGQDKCIKVWDLTSKKELVNVPNVHEGGIYAVHYDEKEIFEHCLATGGAEGYAKITDLRVADKTNACVFIEPYAQMNGKGVYDVKWQGNMLCVGSGVGEVLVYDIRSLKLPIAQFVNDKEAELVAKYKPDYKNRYTVSLRKNGAIRGLYMDNRKIISGSASGIITVSSMENGQYITKFSEINQSDDKQYMMSLSTCDKYMVGVTAYSMLGIYDFTCKKNTPATPTSTTTTTTSSMPSFKSSDKNCNIQ